MRDKNSGTIEPAAYWRLSFIFDAPGHDREALSGMLVASEHAMRMAAYGSGVRFGVAERFLNDMGDAFAGWRTNDGAIEITVPAAQADKLPSIAAAMRPVLETLTDMASVEVMTGPTYFMVPPRLGGTFLSLSFKRDPRTTKEEFGQWWYFQHSAVAIPVLGRKLLAYDQVHCDDGMTAAVCSAFGVPAYHYDAYDNLTWANWQAFLDSTSDPEGGQHIAMDEIGRIDNSTRRHGMMISLS